MIKNSIKMKIKTEKEGRGSEVVYIKQNMNKNYNSK